MNQNQPQTHLSKSTLRQTAEILSPDRSYLLFIAILVIAGASLELVPPLVMKQVVDGHLTVGNTNGLWFLAGLYLGSVALIQGLSFATSYLTARTAQAALHTLRVRLFTHLQHLPLHYFDRTPLGEIIGRCTADVDAVETLFSSGVMGLLTDLTRLVTIFIAMILLSPVLSLVLVLVIPPLVWITNLFRKHIREAERENRQAMGALNSHLQETLGGVEVIRAFGRESTFVARFRKLLQRVLKAYTESTHYSAIFSPIMQILMAFVISLLLWSGARAAFSTLHVTLGTLTAFVLLFKRFFDPITAVGEEWQTVQSALSGAERIFQVLDLPEEASPSPIHSFNLSHQAAGVELHEVTFGYNPEQPVLNHVSFSVHSGEHVVLVGRTGSGKSSVLNLITGLYTPWEGDIRVGGIDPRQIDDHERRKMIGVVPQSVQLFSGSVLDNLTLQDPEVSMKAVRLAVHLTGLDEIIEALPDGFRTQISNGSGSGVQLSSGQRQLLSLSRALVWNPAVLLFDEATSSIDSASEAVFRQALRGKIIRQRAILTVAHRLSTALEADRVIVLDRGRILESGAPGTLAQKGGHFAALLKKESMGLV